MAQASGQQTVPAGGRIQILSGFYQGLELPIDRPRMVIGRGRGVEVVLAEPTISRAHAAIGFEDEGFFVQDLESTNGTMVNGERRERAPLEDRDEIQIGRLHIRIRLPGAAD